MIKIFKISIPIIFCIFSLNTFANNYITNLDKITKKSYTIKVVKKYTIINGEKIQIPKNEQKEIVQTFTPYVYQGIKASYKRANEICSQYFNQFSILSGNPKNALDACLAQYVQSGNIYTKEKNQIPDCNPTELTWGSADKIHYCSAKVLKTYQSGEKTNIIDNLGESKGYASASCIAGEWKIDLTTSNCTQIGTDVKTPEVFNCQGDWVQGLWSDCDEQTGIRERPSTFVISKNATLGGLNCSVANGQQLYTNEKCSKCKGSWVDKGLTPWSTCTKDSTGKSFTTRYTKLVYEILEDAVGVGEKCPEKNGETKFVNPIKKPCDMEPPEPPVEEMTECEKFYEDESNYSPFKSMSDGDTKSRAGNGVYHSWVLYQTAFARNNKDGIKSVRAIKYNEKCLTPPKSKLYKGSGNIYNYPNDYYYIVDKWCDPDESHYKPDLYVNKFNSTQSCQAPISWYRGKRKKMVEDASYAKAAGSYRCTGNRFVSNAYVSLCKKDTLEQKTNPVNAKPSWISSSMMFLKEKGKYDCEIKNKIVTTTNDNGSLTCSGNVDLLLRNGSSEMRIINQTINGEQRRGVINYKCELGVLKKVTESCRSGSNNGGGSGGGSGGGNQPPRNQV